MARPGKGRASRVNYLKCERFSSQRFDQAQGRLENELICNPTITRQQIAQLKTQEFRQICDEHENTDQLCFDTQLDGDNSEIRRPNSLFCSV